MNEDDRNKMKQAQKDRPIDGWIDKQIEIET